MPCRLVDAKRVYLFMAMTETKGNSFVSHLIKRIKERYWARKLGMMTEGEILDMYYALTGE